MGEGESDNKDALNQYIDDLLADNRQLRERIEALERFRAAVVGWREFDQPEWFDRRTAEAVADLGREHEGAE